MRNKLRVVSIILLTVSSGCLLSSGPGESIGFSGELTASTEEFHMDGDIINGARGDPPVFENVTVYLFAANKTLIHKEPAGKLVRRAAVSIEIERVPKYVIIHSEEFWHVGKISVSYYVLHQDDEIVYSEHVVSEKDELPVKPSEP